MGPILFVNISEFITTYIRISVHSPKNSSKVIYHWVRQAFTIIMDAMKYPCFMILVFFVSLYFSEFIATTYIFRDLSPYRLCQELIFLVCTKWQHLNSIYEKEFLFESFDGLGRASCLVRLSACSQAATKARNAKFFLSKFLSLLDLPILNLNFP